MANELHGPDADFWIKYLEGSVTNNPVSSPMWREGIFALYAFQDQPVQTWIHNYIGTLTPEQYRENGYLIKELMSPHKIHKSAYSEADVKDGSL